MIILGLKTHEFIEFILLDNIFRCRELVNHILLIKYLLLLSVLTKMEVKKGDKNGLTQSRS